MAFLAKCPDCGKFQVCVLDVEDAINLKCQRCGGIFTPVSDPVPAQDNVNWSLATTMAGYEYEPPRRSKENLVVITNLPSIYPNQRPPRRYKPKRRRKRRTPRIEESRSTPVPALPPPETLPPESEPHERETSPTDEAIADPTAPKPAPQAPVSPSPSVANLYGLPPPDFDLQKGGQTGTIASIENRPDLNRGMLNRSSASQAPVQKPRRDRLPVKKDDDDDLLEWQLQRTRLLAVASLCLLGVSLILIQINSGRWVALSVATIAFVISVWSLLIRTRTLGAFATCSVAAFAAVLLFSPSWLGIRPFSDKDLQRERTVFAVGLDGKAAPVSDGWVEMSTASWQLKDVRARATFASIGPINLAEPTGKTRQTKEPYIVIRVHLGNVGAERNLQVPQWTSTPGAVPRLRSFTGFEFRLARFEDRWKPKSPSATVIPPGRFADIFLYFEASGNLTDQLLLELPGGPLGLPEDIRMKLPSPRGPGR